jgi:hypothetical protein
MGWWTQDAEGHSFSHVKEGPELIWGDGPADILDDAILAIKKEFRERAGRDLTAEEMRAGFEFSMGGFE